jgi:Uma2 family endonuclease
MTSTLEMPKQQHAAGAVVLKGISWDLYEKLLAQLEHAGQHIYLTYDRGALEIMAPSSFHERYKKVIGRLVEAMALELRIPIYGLGSTTFKRKDLERGLEPDECYYVQHEPQMGRKANIDLRVDPAPDLAVEMDYTHHALDRSDIYAALGVPEIWQYDGEHLRGFSRNSEGAYDAIDTSIAFPFLKLADVERFIALAKSSTQDNAVREFCDWVRQTFPRRQP